MYPKKGQYVNIHAHRASSGEREWVIRSFTTHQYLPGEMDPDTQYSVGLHPWDIDRADPEVALNQVRSSAEDPKVIAIGETGLDAAISTPPAIQMQVFKTQVKIADQAGLPVIIHAVRSYQELIGFMKVERPSVQMIIHGYSGGSQLANDLVKFGFMLSFGASLMKSDKVSAAFKQLSLEEVFIETDESEISIENLYAYAAELKEMSTEHLKEQMAANVMRVFKFD